MNAISAPLKRIREQLRAPGADQSHVSKLSANAQRDLSLLKEHKTIKKAKARMRTTQLQQQQHSQPESPIQLMTRFRYQPHSDQAPSASPNKAASAGVVPLTNDALEAPVTTNAPPRSSRKLGRLPNRGASPEVVTADAGGGGPPVGDGKSSQTPANAGSAQAGSATAVWHRCLGYGDGTEMLPDSVSRTLERGVRTGQASVTVRIDDQECLVDLRMGRMMDSSTGEVWDVFRDDFGEMDFYGRKEFLAKFRQEELLRIRQRREDKRLKRLRHKAPAHCHIWHNPNSEEVSKIPCQFPANTLQQSLRRIVAFGAGAKHVTECNDAPSLDDALPILSLSQFDQRRREGQGMRKMSVRMPVTQGPPPDVGCSSPGDEGHEADTECQRTEAGSTIQLPALRGTQTSLLGSTISGGNKRPRTPETRAGKQGGGEATSSSGEADDVGSPDASLPPTTPAPRKEAAEMGEEDETAYHGHQLFANNFAGIRQLISEMNDKGGLPRLEPPKDKRRRDEIPSPRKDAKSVGSPRQPQQKGGQKSGDDSEDEWGGASSGEEDAPPSHVMQTTTTASKQRDLDSWQRQLLGWQGPLDIRGDEEGSASSDDNDYDPNCTICRMYDARGGSDSPTAGTASAGPAATAVGAPSGGGWVRREERGRIYWERVGENPYLQKIQEWKNLQYSAKLQISLRLHDSLDERMATKAYAMQSPVCIAQLGRAAEANARQWETGRFTSGPGGPAGIPTIWNNASTHLRLERHRAAQCILLYSRLLWYIERIGGLTTEGQVDLVNRVRKLLVHDGRVSRRFFFDLLRDAGPDVVEPRENMKILHYLRIELCLSSGDLIRFIRRHKHRGWYLTRDLQILADKLKKREQSGRGVTSPR
eukprot:Hpha_TRINITY_DN15188_c1_g2::TRINITY_DN15188_c1_g2_i1::g.128498::m.128498